MVGSSVVPKLDGSGIDELQKWGYQFYVSLHIRLPKGFMLESSLTTWLLLLSKVVIAKTWRSPSSYTNWWRINIEKNEINQTNQLIEGLWDLEGDLTFQPSWKHSFMTMTMKENMQTKDENNEIVLYLFEFYKMLSY